MIIQVNIWALTRVLSSGVPMISIIRLILFTFCINFGQSPEQIKQAKNLIKQKGLSQKEVRNAALSQGFTDKQIEAAINKEKSSKAKVNDNDFEELNILNLPEIGSSNTLNEASLESIPENKNVDMLTDQISKDKDILSKPEFFGYDIFKRDPELFQASSVGAVDPDYLIGPGDEIIVMLWGETQFRQVLKVDREGFVFVPEIGQVFVNGLNLNLLESKIFRVFSQSYASLNPQGRSPTTFLDVSLGNLRPLRIQVLGEVAQPGAYTVSPTATLFSSLYYFDGPTNMGSLRDIQLIRDGNLITSIDFYNYLLSGEKPKDERLQLDDVIFIPQRSKTVTIYGEINRSGIYELKEDENLNSLIKIAGNLKITAYTKRAQIDRVVPFKDRNNLGMDRMFIDVNLEELIESEEFFNLHDNDKIKIFSINDNRHNVVELQGAVVRPGIYDLGDSLRLSELINKADGLLGDAFLERVDIVRMKPDYTEELIKLNLSESMKETIEDDIYLKSRDKVMVYSINQMIPRSYVSIEGHVKRPGKFLLQDNLTLYDLIFKAGGFADEEYKRLTYLDRAELIRARKNSDDKEIIPFNLDLVLNGIGIADTLLKSQDAVRIYSISEVEGDRHFVTIKGHVKRPGKYELFEKNMRIYDLLFSAGGFDDTIFKSKTYLDRADLIRFESDQTAQKIIHIDLNKILSDKGSQYNILLQPGDLIRIYPESIFNSVGSVTIKGVIKNPGNYKLKSNMTIKDLILEAGGLINNIHSKVDVARIDIKNQDLDNYAVVATLFMDDNYNIIKKDNSKLSLLNNSKKIEEFQLEPYDLVTIRPNPFFSLQKQVIITGEVMYPGSYTILSSNEKVSDIIARAGGLRPNAYLNASTYFRNGLRIKTEFDKIVKKPKIKLNFSIQDGDSIHISQKKNFVQVEGEVNSGGIHKFMDGKRLNYYLDISGGLNPNADKDNIWIEYPNGDSKRLSKLSLYSPTVEDGSKIYVGRKEEREPIDKTELAKEITSILANFAQVITIIMLASP